MKDLSHKEHRIHSSPYIPYSYYECLIPDYYPFVPSHWHSEFEINYILDGEGTFRCDSNCATVKAGDIIVILPNMLHSITRNPNKKLKYETIVFNKSLIIGDVGDRCFQEFLYPLTSPSSNVELPISATSPYYSDIKACVRNIFSCIKENCGSLDFLLKSELIRMFWLVIESGCLSNCEDNAQLIKSILPAIHFIENNFRDKITIDMLAQKVHLSKSYFMFKFKAIIGMGALQYVEQVRIRAACEMLVSSDMTSSEIAFSVGFGNLSNFNRQFRKSIGCSPFEYRKKYK